MFKSKVYRLFCFLFVFSLVFALFGVEVSAASNENLISSDITTWTDGVDLDTDFTDMVVTTAGNIYRVSIYSGVDTDGLFLIGTVFDHTKLIAGHSYSLSFKMPSRQVVNEAFNKNYSNDVFNGHFAKCQISIGVGFISPSGEFNTPDECCLFNINPDNYTDFFGKSLNASFVASNYSGTPVVYIGILSNNTENHSFYFSDFNLVDNDDNSAELTGIKGFLHSIRWDLVGGVCSEDDCPHSSSDNPHLSLTERMSTGFASMFQSVNDNFTKDDSKLKSWFTSLGESITSFFKDSDGKTLKDWFTGLGDKITAFFKDSDGKTFSNWFKDLGTNIGGFFTDLKTNVSGYLTSLGSTITGKLDTVGKKFSDFFDKFKPRVSISFKWVKGSLNPNTGVVDSSTAMNACVTEYFDVLDNPYYIEFHKSQGDFVSGFYYKYDLDHNFISYKNISPDSEPIVLEPGYSYRFRLYRGANVTELYGDNLSKVCNELIVVYAEEGWVNALLYNMKMGIKGLFVPDEAFIATWKEEMDGELESHLGFLYQIPDFIISYVQVIRNTLKDNDTISFTFPKIEFDFNGEHIHLWDAIDVDFSFLEKEPFSTIYSIYKVGISIIFGAALVMYGKHVWEKVIGN